MYTITKMQPYTDVRVKYTADNNRCDFFYNTTMPTREVCLVAMLYVVHLWPNLTKPGFHTHPV